jgi:cytochrome c oxidase assembly protein subunit 15
MGCGNHWPDCNGSLVPDLSRYAVAVEVTHRCLAATLLLATLALALVAFARRRDVGVGGRGGVLRPAALAVALVVTAALFGMLIVRLELGSPPIIALHYSLAMALLATLVVAAQRTGALGAGSLPPGGGGASSRTYRGALAGAILAFATVVLGALTANVPGAAAACQGFPWCRTLAVPTAGGALHVQLTHRVLAFLLFLHLVGLAIAVTRRGESRPVVRAAQLAAGLVIAQLIVAAALVELHLPPALQSLHQAVGTLVWVVVFALAALAKRGAPPAQAAGA